MKTPFPIPFRTFTDAPSATRQGRPFFTGAAEGVPAESRLSRKRLFKAGCIKASCAVTRPCSRRVGKVRDKDEGVFRCGHLALLIFSFTKL